MYFSDIADLMNSTGVTRMIMSKMPAIFLDGFPAEGFGPPPEWIDKIEFVRFASIPGRGFWPGSLLLYQKRRSKL